MAKIRYRVEQSFAILHSQYLDVSVASLFWARKGQKGQMGLKVICLNLLKAANKLRLVAPIDCLKGHKAALYIISTLSLRGSVYCVKNFRSKAPLVYRNLGAFYHVLVIKSLNKMMGVLHYIKTKF